MEAPSGKLNNAEFRALIGCGRAQVTRWEKKGLPYVTVKSRRGSPAHIYDRTAALRWVEEHGTGNFPLEASRLLKESEKPKAKAKRRGRKPAAKVSESGTLQDRLTATLLKSSESFDRWDQGEKEAFEEGNYAKAALCAKNRAEAGKAVAQLQERVTAQAKEMGTLVVASEMEGRYLKVLATVRNNILGIPDSAIPVLMPLLRDPEDAVRVRDLLTAKVEDALRHIADAEIDG